MARNRNLDDLYDEDYPLGSNTSTQDSDTSEIGSAGGQSSGTAKPQSNDDMSDTDDTMDD